MYGTTKAHDVEPITSYNKADRHFNQTRAVRSIKWQEDERPLRRRSQHHYRLKHGTWQGRNFYDVIHWHTPLIRYWEPLENGDEVTSVMYYDSHTSRQFLWAHGWGWQRTFKDTYGNDATAYISARLNTAHNWYEGFMRKGGTMEFTTHLVFDADGRLKTDESLMVPLFGKVSTAEDKERRAARQQEMSMMLDILTTRYHEYAANVRADRGSASAFGGLADASYKTLGSVVLWDLKRTAQTHGLSLTHPEVAKHMEGFLNLGQVVMNMLYGKRVYKKYGYLPSATPNAETADLIPTADDMRASLSRHFMEWTGTVSEGRKAYPLFAESYPRTTYLAQPDMDEVLANELQARFTNLMGRLALSNV